MNEDFLTEFLPGLDAAHQAIGDGNPEVWLAHWSTNEPISLMGAFGYPAIGQLSVRRTVRAAMATRLAGFKYLSTDHAAADVGKDRAYTVGVERWVGSVNGDAPGQVEIRVTEIFRLEDGRWRLAHRHGDFIRAEYGAR